MKGNTLKEGTQTRASHTPPQPLVGWFWPSVLSFILLLAMGSGVVIWQGSRAHLRARALTPAPQSVASMRPHIQLTFTRPMDPASIEPTISLTPPVSLTLQWTENTLRLIPHTALDANTVYTITVGPGAQDATGLPLDGQIQWSFSTRAPRLVYLQPTNDDAAELAITAIDQPGAPSERLSAPGQAVQDFDIAPDGNLVVYTVAEGPNTAHLWKVAPPTRGWSRLTEGLGLLYGAPRFGPTGDLLAIELREEVTLGDQGSVLSPPRIELRRPTDGSPAGTIYGGGATTGHSPRWSPDGNRLAFFESTKGAIGLFNFTTDLRFFPAESANLGPQAWSPNSQALIYTIVRVAAESAQQIIVVRDLHLGTETPFAEPVGNLSDPAWSPDGELIAYAYQPPHGLGRGGEIWLMRPDGSAKLPLVAQPGVIFTQPLWSPDGAWLALSRFDLNNPDTPNQLWVVQRDGTNLQPVVENGFLANWLP